MSAGPILYRAAWVCPVSQPPIKNGCVLVVDDRIAAVETFSEALDLASQLAVRLIWVTLPSFQGWSTLTRILNSVS